MYGYVDVNRPRYPHHDGERAIDLHGMHPHDLEIPPWGTAPLLRQMIQEAWEAGCRYVRFIYGHGLGRPSGFPTPGSNTGYLGITVRRGLRALYPDLKQMMVSRLDVSHEGSTVVKLKRRKLPRRRPA